MEWAGVRLPALRVAIRNYSYSQTVLQSPVTQTQTVTQYLPYKLYKVTNIYYIFKRFGWENWFHLMAPPRGIKQVWDGLVKYFWPRNGWDLMACNNTIFLVCKINIFYCEISLAWPDGWISWAPSWVRISQSIPGKREDWAGSARPEGGRGGCWLWDHRTTARRYQLSPPPSFLPCLLHPSSCLLEPVWPCET